MQFGSGYGAQTVLMPNEAQDNTSRSAALRAQSQLATATLPDEIAMSGDKAAASALSLANLKTSSLAKTTETNQSLIANAAALAQTPEEWDQAMQALADKGVDGARQFIGRYSNRLKGAVANAYSASSPTSALGAMQNQLPAGMAQSGLAGAGADAGVSSGAGAGDFDKALAQLPPPAIKALYQKTEAVRNAIEAVANSANPQAEWDKQAVAIGHPEWAGHYSDQALAQLAQQTIPLANALRGRVTREDMGLPTIAPAAETKEVGGVLYERDPRTGQWSAKTPRISTLGADQQLVEVGPGGAAAASTEGVPLDQWAKKMQGSENATGDPNAKNPRSSAAGNGQFLGYLDKSGVGHGTWFDMVKENRPDLAKGKTDAQILAMRGDPALNDQMTQAYARDNAVGLKASDHQVNGATLALAHRFGITDAKDILDASPATPISSLVRPAVMRANPDLQGKTAGDVGQQFAKKFGIDPVAVPGLSDGQSAPSGVPGVRILASGSMIADGNQKLDDKAVDYIAEQFVGTGKMPPMGMGKAATANRNAVLNKAAEIEAATGATGQDAATRWATMKADTAALSNLSKQAAMINAFESTALKNADQVVLLAPKGVGGSAPVLNRWINAGRREIAGDPDVSKFNLAVGTLADEYAKVVSGGTGSTAVTDSARAEAYSRINSAMTVNQLQNVIAQMKIEMENRRTSLAEEQTHIQAHMHSGGTANADTASAPGAPGSTSKPGGVAYQGGYPVLSPDQARQWAQVPTNKGKRFMTADGRMMAF